MKAARKIYNNVATNEPGTLCSFGRQLCADIAIVTPLQARTFGIWTLTSGVVRWYCAYNIHQKVYVAASVSHAALSYPRSSVYDMTLFTYLLAFGHFSSELLIFRTTKLGAPVLSPVIVSSKSIMRFH